MSIAYLGLGGNLGDSQNILQSALEKLTEDHHIRLIKMSSFYRSKPLENKPQPDYINAVAKIETEYSAIELLSALQFVEACFGRVRNGEHWASRTLDLDILLYNDLKISNEKLTVPHAEMLQRDFVLYPLYEISPDIMIPGFGALQNALDSCENRGLEKLNDNNP